jgi:hypothetical protein
MDDCAYGADEVNQVFSKLTTEGVSLFNYTDQSNPLVAFNDAVKGFITPGVEMYNADACKVTYDEENDKFTIGVGNAFMCDGSSITIDSEAYDITQEVLEQRKLSDGDIWVCFYRNIPNNCIDIVVSADDTLSNSEYAVPLAKISADNSVVDKREFAKTKVAPCSANVIQEVTIKLGTLTYKDTGYQLRRLIIENVFPGATKVFLNGVVRNIQRVDIEAGESLTYERAWYPTVASDVKIAFNMTGEGLEVWASQPYDSTTPGNWNITIF